MAWDFSTEPEFERKLEWMRRFVREEVFPLEVLDTDDQTFMRIVRSLQEEVKRQGLWAAHLPPELGGQGYGQVKLALMHEIDGMSPWAPIVFGNQAPDSGNAEVLALYGTPEQKRRWLQPLLAGEIRSGFSMTEPMHAGSDPTVMSTTAVLEGDEWRIDGHKWFTTNGMIADFLIVMAVTDPDAPPHRRASMFIVPADAPGLKRLRNIPTMAGGHERFGYGHAEVRYEGVRIPRENLIGEVGQGFEIAQARLGPGRIHHCMRWLGQARRAFDMLCERALQRQAFGGPLAEKQTVENWIADSAAEMQAARLMTLHAAWVIDTQGTRAARTEISLIKFYGAKVLHDVIDRAIQIHGSWGYSGDLPLEEMYRHARAARLYDGPDEVHRQTVARRILREYRAPEGWLPSEHIPSRRAAAQRKFAELLDQAAANL
ncbi:MAG TPA: acyl-CoA dehydrogenase family protein [Candidatus Dormibacteraeota bacterium]|nr:acyl-CoA dehydrogenase family protein [Candidatus Dormibacteraeota bacterium]